MPLTLGLAAVESEHTQHKLVTLGLAAILTLAQLTMLLGGRTLARVLVSVTLLSLILALASYALPEYWIPLSR